MTMRLTTAAILLGGALLTGCAATTLPIHDPIYPAAGQAAELKRDQVRSPNLETEREDSEKEELEFYTQTSPLYDRQQELDHGFIGLRSESHATPRTCQSTSWAPMEGMTTSFIAVKENTKLAVSISGDFTMNDSAGTLYVRALVDSVASTPNTLEFANGKDKGVSSGVFYQSVSQGLHTVRMECKVNKITSVALYQNTTIKTTQGKGPYEMDGYATDVDVTLSSTVWKDIPSLSKSLYATAGDYLSATVSLETRQTSGYMEIRAQRNGVTLSPSPVRFDNANSPAVHSITFVDPTKVTSTGWKTLKIQYKVSRGSSIVRNRVLYVESRPSEGFSRVREVVTGSTKTESSGKWQVLASKAMKVPTGSELAITLSVPEINWRVGDNFKTRLVVDGHAMEPTEIIHSKASSSLDSLHQHYTAKGFYTARDEKLRQFEIEWKVDDKFITLFDPTLLIDAEIMMIPDFADAAILTDEVAEDGDYILDTQEGELPPLVILVSNFKDKQTGYAPTVNDFRNWTTMDNGLVDYIDRLSGGRVTMDPGNVFVFGNPPYTVQDLIDENIEILEPNRPWIDAATNNELDPEDFVGYEDKQCGANFGPFKKRGELHRYYALRAAEERDGLDLTVYDNNNDGIVDQTEVLLLFVSKPGGCNATARPVVSFCDNDLDHIIHSSDPNRSDKILKKRRGSRGNAMNMCFGAAPTTGHAATFFHEMSHSLYGLGDLYSGSDSNSYRAGRYALMARGNGSVRSHMGSANRLRLGWATPRVVTEAGLYAIDKVGDSDDVLILPRKQMDHQGKGEYFTITNRRSSAVDNATELDQGLPDSGIAIWHVVPRADRDNAVSSCHAADDLSELSISSSNKESRFISARDRCNDGAADLPRLWQSGEAALLDVAPDPPGAGSSCSADCNAQDGSNGLVWSDGSRSGYILSHWSPAADTMTLRIAVPSCEGRCWADYDPDMACQCDELCSNANIRDCCWDKAPLCEIFRDGGPPFP